MKKNYYIFGLLIFLSLALVATFLYTNNNKNTSTITTTTTTSVKTNTLKIDNTPPTYESLNNLANQINAKLPLTIDDYTIMQHVDVPNATAINYEYILTKNFFKESSLNEFNTIFIPKLKTNLCQSPELQNLIKHNINLNYIYYQNTTQVFAQFTLNKKNCIF